MIEVTEALISRFWSRVDCRSSTECWPWLMTLTRQGYGRFNVHSKKHIPAHRFAYLVTAGIPDWSLVVDHICRNRHCCNPAHLRLITNAENMMIGIGSTAQNARKTHCLRGHPLADGNLSLKKSGSRRCLTCHRAEEQRRREQRIRALDPLSIATSAGEG